MARPKKATNKTIGSSTRKIELSASFTGTIPTGSFENEKPFYSITETFDNCALGDVEIEIRHKQLHDMCYRQFKNQAEITYAERIDKLYKNIRFYDKDGRKYPSVTSIIGWDESFRIPVDSLAQYAARGTIVHKQIEVYLTTGEWKEAKDITDIYPELVILRTGNLKLELEGDFKAFYESYPFKVIECEKVIYNDKHYYAGKLDCLGVIEHVNMGKWASIDGIKFDVPTVFDFKTGAVDKVKCFKQLTAYGQSVEGVEQLAVIPINNDTKQGFSKPVVEGDKEKYMPLFLADRRNFKERYGI